MLRCTSCRKEKKKQKDPLALVASAAKSSLHGIAENEDREDEEFPVDFFESFVEA